MPPNTPPVPPTTQTFATFTGTYAYTPATPEEMWATVDTYASPPRRAPRRATGIDRMRLDLEAFAAPLTPKTKFTWESWLNLWGKVAEAHEKRVYLIPDEPPITVTPTVPEPVVAPTVPRYIYQTVDYVGPTFYDDSAPF